MGAISFSLLLGLIAGAVLADEHVKTESDLRKALFENYDKLVRPVRNSNDVVPVLVDLAPVHIKDVDVKDRTVKLHTWFFMGWEDAYLRWDPAEYGGLYELHIQPSEIWKPDIALYTATPDVSVFPAVQTEVIIMFNGTVIWVPPFTFKSLCSPTEAQDTADTFHCSLKVGSWTNDVRRVRMQEKAQDILQAMGSESFLDINEKWTLQSMIAHSEEKTYSCCPNPYSQVTYDLVFKKKAHSDD